MRLPPAFVPMSIVGDGRQEAAVGCDDIDGSLEGVLVGNELGDELGEINPAISDKVVAISQSHLARSLNELLEGQDA